MLSAAASVRLMLFGGASLHDRNGPIAGPVVQPRRLGVLALLSAAGPRGVRRDSLVAFLWPELSPDRANHRLADALYGLREQLGRDSIIAVGGELLLNSEVVGSDIGEFQDAIERCEWERAVRLYRGPFLDGFFISEAPEFERWGDEERTRFARLYARALSALAVAAETRQDCSAALEWWRTLAAQDPFSSQVALRLMQAAAAAGDPAAALRHGRAHEALLRAELGIEPPPEFNAFVQRLQLMPLARTPAVAAAAGADAVTISANFSDAADRSAEAPMAPAAQSLLRITAATQPRARFVPLAILGSIMLALGGAIALRSRAGSDAAEQIPAASDMAAARELYLRGRNAWNRRSREGLQESVVLFRQASERDPTSVEAFVGLADAYVMLGYFGYLPGDATFPKGRAAALRALALDSTSGEASTALGQALQWERRWGEAEHAFRRALRNAPSYATAHQWYALLLTILGRSGEAVEHARHAAEMDPLSVQIQNAYAITLYHAGHVDSALHVYERMIRDEPDTAWVRQNPWVMSNFGKVAAAAGRHAEAVQLIQRAAAAAPRHPRPLYDLSVAYLFAGDSARARASFAAADTLHPHYLVYRALLFAQLGDMEAAFDCLDRVPEWVPVLLLTLCCNPGLEPLHSDPRYQTLLKRLRLR